MVFWLIWCHWDPLHPYWYCLRSGKGFSILGPEVSLSRGWSLGFISKRLPWPDSCSDSIKISAVGDAEHFSGQELVVAGSPLMGPTGHPCVSGQGRESQAWGDSETSGQACCVETRLWAAGRPQHLLAGGGKAPPKRRAFVLAIDCEWSCQPVPRSRGAGGSAGVVRGSLTSGGISLPRLSSCASWGQGMLSLHHPLLGGGMWDVLLLCFSSGFWAPNRLAFFLSPCRVLLLLPLFVIFRVYNFTRQGGAERHGFTTSCLDPKF